MTSKSNQMKRLMTINDSEKIFMDSESPDSIDWGTYIDTISAQWWPKNWRSLPIDQLDRYMAAMLADIEKVNDRFLYALKDLQYISSVPKFKLQLAKMSAFQRLVVLLDRMEYENVVALDMLVVGLLTLYSKELRELIFTESNQVISVVLKVLKKEEKEYPRDYENRSSFIQNLLCFIGNLMDMDLRKDDAIRIFQKVDLMIQFNAKIICNPKTPLEHFQAILGNVNHVIKFSGGEWGKVAQPLLEKEVVQKLKVLTEKTQSGPLTSQLSKTAFLLIADLILVESNGELFNHVTRVLKTSNDRSLLLSALAPFCTLATQRTNIKLATDVSVFIGNLLGPRLAQQPFLICLILDALYLACNSKEIREKVVKGCSNSGNEFIQMFYGSGVELLRSGSSEPLKFLFEHSLLMIQIWLKEDDKFCERLEVAKQIGLFPVVIDQNQFSDPQMEKVLLLFFAFLYDRSPNDILELVRMNPGPWDKFYTKVKKEFAGSSDQQIVEAANHITKRYEAFLNKRILPTQGVSIDFEWKPTTKLRDHERSNKGELLCDHCGSKNPTKRCSKCKSAAYCKRECQIAAWPKHKHTCKPNK